MEPEYYEVEVVHFINPYLIWVKVPGSSRDDFYFEQIGVYGIVPLEMTMDMAEDTLVTRKTTEWMPAATVLLNNLFAEEARVLFYPIPTQARNSIFDDSPQKFGEIVLKKPNGKVRFLSELLHKSAVALHDEQLFEHELNSGNVKTKLSHNKTKEVVRHLERKDKQQLAKQTTVFHAALEIESALTVENLEAHNKRTKNHISIEEKLQRKLDDLEMCKNIEMDSVGRASSRLSRKSGNSKLSLLKHKLSLLKPRQKDDCESDVTSGHYRKDNTHVKLACQSADSSMQQNTFEFNNDNRTENSVTKSPGYVASTAKFSKEETSDEFEENRSGMNKDEEILERKENFSWDDDSTEQLIKKLKPKKSPKGKKIPEYNKLTEIRVAYGPPDTTQNLIQKIFPKNQLFETYVPVEVKESELPAKKEKEDIFENEDSDVEDMHNFSKDAPKLDVVLSNDSVKFDIGKSSGIVQKTHKIYESKSEHVPPKSEQEHRKSIRDNSNSLLKRKLQAQKYFLSKSFDSSNSDTSNKDSTTSVEDDVRKTHKVLSHINPHNRCLSQNPPLKKSESKIVSLGKVDSNIESDVDNISEIIDKLYPKSKTISKPNIEEIYTSYVKMKNNVNPLKNVDPNLSVFVDKLVTPILMVHSKLNKRLLPTFELRDVPFTTHIQIILKNMGVEKPMMLQSITWGAILRGYSIFVVSPKNSGKTIGYLPAVCRLVADHDSGIDGTGPSCIIVCSTSNSVSEVGSLAKIFLGSKERVLTFYSGMSQLEMTTALLNGCDLFVCTPSILVRLLQLDFGIDLRRLTTFVLDDCERLSEVYLNEIKFFLFKIKEMLKIRITKEVKVQYVLASRIWCDFMEPLSKKAPDTVICIGAFQECVLYSKANTTASFVTKENKINTVLKFLQEFDTSKRTVIVCRTDEEVNVLEKALIQEKYVVFACNNTMTVQDLYNLRGSWDDYQEPIIGPILLCCDGNLTHLNITDANYLIHYSLPSLFSMFCKRFSVLNDNYSSIFREEKDRVKIKILLEDSNVEQLPKILHFIKRCTPEVPEILDEICDKVLAEKDDTKAKNLVPICDNLMALGKCPDFWNCRERHAVLLNYDNPKHWIPEDGFIKFKILHYHTATLYSARLLERMTKDKSIVYPQNYNMLAMKIAMYFSRESNQKLLGVPKVGDICAVSIRQNFFARCQVIKILSYYQKGNPNYVLVRLLDEEKLERTRDIYLYHLPEEMRSVETHCAQIRLANIQPRDQDITFSPLAKKQLKKITDNDEDLYLRGQVVLTIGNCVFIDSLEACRDLSSLCKTVVIHDFKRELLENHAIPNPEHLSRLEKKCEDGGLAVKKERQTKSLPKLQWAQLDKDEVSTVIFTFGIDPGTFFVRLEKYSQACVNLNKEIQKYVLLNPKPIENVSVGDIVLARLPDDLMYDRARIEQIHDNGKITCFYVDHGDCRDISKTDIIEITEEFITKVPFQAIECRLIGVKPPGERWNEFSINWFINCFETNDDSSKLVFAKYYKQEVALHTNGYKHAVALIDTSYDEDIVINHLILNLNLGSKDEPEYSMCNLDAVIANTEDTENKSDDENEKERVLQSTRSNLDPVPLRGLFPEKPIRSVPLVESDFDSENEDKWDSNFTKDFMGIIKPAHAEPQTAKDFILSNIPAITEAPIKCVSQHQSDINSSVLKVTPSQKIKELDSDDYTSPELTQVSLKTKELSHLSETSTKTLQKITHKDVSRKPKVIWRQRKTNISIKIMLIGVDKYDIEIEKRRLKFSAMANETKYEFDIDLYGLVNVNNSNHSNKGQYILIHLTKIIHINWLTLTKNVGVQKWIVYDVDSIDVSSDEDYYLRYYEEVILANVNKNTVQDDSETEEEDDFIYD